MAVSVASLVQDDMTEVLDRPAALVARLRERPGLDVLENTLNGLDRAAELARRGKA